MTGGAALFFDRDGVLNAPTVLSDGSERAPWSIEAVVLLAGARDALDLARSAGFVPVIITNQPDVGRGDLSPDVARAINDAIAEAVGGVAGVYACFHGGGEGCSCRKPRPGMLVQAAGDLGLDLAASWVIGDRWVDIAAAEAAGCRSVLVERPGSWLPTSAGTPPAGLMPTYVALSALEAVRRIVAIPGAAGA